MGAGDDRERIREHQERVQHLVIPMAARYSFLDGLGATPEGRAVLDAPNALRPSLAITALAGPRSGWTAAHAVEVPRSEMWPAELVRALVRRRIGWDPASAALALRIVAGTDFDDERIQLVLKASDRIAEAHPGHPEVVDGLERLDERVRGTPPHRYRVPEMQARVTAAIARHTPPDLLDLSPIATTDTWGPAARARLEAAAGRGVDVTAALRCLTAAPSSSEPSVRWLESAGRSFATPEARATARDLVRLLVDLDLEEGRPFVAAGNDAVARAAIWAFLSRVAPAADLTLLRDVAIRCSRTNGKPYATDALCGKAAGAAVTVLGRVRRDGGRGAATAERNLDALWREVDRGDVLRRVGKVLGRTDEQIAARVAEAKRTKATRKAHRIDPQPTARREQLADVIGVDVAARLATLGFDDRSRQTFRRHQPRHSDVVTISTAAASVHLAFGVGYHDEGERPAWKLDDLDVAVQLALVSTPAEADGTVDYLRHRGVVLRDRFDRRAARGEVDPVVVLADLLVRFEAVGLPSLERWADPRRLADDLEVLDVPCPHGELLGGLDRPNGTERRRAIRRLRSLG